MRIRRNSFITAADTTYLRSPSGGRPDGHDYLVDPDHVEEVRAMHTRIMAETGHRWTSILSVATSWAAFLVIAAGTAALLFDPPTITVNGRSQTGLNFAALQVISVTLLVGLLVVGTSEFLAGRYHHQSPATVAAEQLLAEDLVIPSWRVTDTLLSPKEQWASALAHRTRFPGRRPGTA